MFIFKKHLSTSLTSLVHSTNHYSKHIYFLLIHIDETRNITRDFYGINTDLETNQKSEL